MAGSRRPGAVLPAKRRGRRGPASDSAGDA